MVGITVYHHGECSKCRGALELLQEAGIPHDVRFYIAEPLDVGEIKGLLTKLRARAEDLVRKTEPFFIANFGDKIRSENEWIEVLRSHPELMQRPIVVKGDRAIIARPPEKVLEFVK